MTLASLLLCSAAANADYAHGCDDPAYKRYMQTRFAHFEAQERRLFTQTLRDYEQSLALNSNPFQIISDLSRHIKYSAQFDEIELAQRKIDRVFEHTDELSKEQHIAAYVVDSFSSESHAVGIARARLLYRQGKQEQAFEALLEALEVSDSEVLRSFGPDFDLVRQIYQDGHKQIVLVYLDKTESFWTGRRPDGLRYVWREMIKAGCAVQFDSVDTIKALELGLSVIDVNKDYGLGR